ncbi:cytochrome P450 9e2-like [Hylaeus anthracinus]|uniref:cytochrome P450 9e2-like n=1 Tax=Hylaeus anthracinus TaxID=313031 RepID=UPI0023B8DD75|nr:cytochrome P450 9e2-like [Hylaeus anthracinus]
MMELSSVSFSFKLLVTAIVTISLAKFVSILHRQLTHWRNRRVPYIWSMPVFGTGWRVFSRLMSFPDYAKFIYHYYPNVKYVGIMDFATPTVVIRDPELIKEISVKSFEHFPDHLGFVSEEVDPIFGRNIFSLRGDRWRVMRNTLSPSFTTSKMKFMFSLVSKCSKEFVGYLYDHPEFSSSMETKDAFTRYTNDVIATAAFGISVNSLEDRENEFFTRGTDATKFGGLGRLLKFMLFRFSPCLSRLMGLSFLSPDSASFFYRIVSETVKTRDKENIVRPDMIHLLMQARDKEKSSTHRMTIEDIIAQVFIFFLAGFDTSSTLMCYLVHELTVNQDIQEKLREEVERYMAEGNGDISYEALSKMEYMEMVTSETLRKYPPVVFIDRLCAEKFELPSAGPGYDGVIVRPTDVVWFPVYAIHHDPNYFPDPEKFDPERFSRKNIDSIQPYTYMPFGFGPRKCIGNRFALMETKILIAHLLHRFRLHPTEKTKHPVTFSKAHFSLLSDDGFWVGLEKRNV